MFFLVLSMMAVLVELANPLAKYLRSRNPSKLQQTILSINGHLLCSWGQLIPSRQAQTLSYRCNFEISFLRVNTFYNSPTWVVSLILCLHIYYSKHESFKSQKRRRHRRPRERSKDSVQFNYDVWIVCIVTWCILSYCIETFKRILVSLFTLWLRRFAYSRSSDTVLTYN